VSQSHPIGLLLDMLLKISKKGFATHGSLLQPGNKAPWTIIEF
jgi:hypothetical protein